MVFCGVPHQTSEVHCGYGFLIILLRPSKQSRVRDFSVSREESPLFAFYKLDSLALYSVCCLLIILFLLCLLFPALVYPPLCFIFLMVWCLVLHLLSFSIPFACWFWFFLWLWDYAFVTDLSRDWKEGICIEGQLSHSCWLTRRDRERCQSPTLKLFLCSELSWCIAAWSHKV